MIEILVYFIIFVTMATPSKYSIECPKSVSTSQSISQQEAGWDSIPWRGKNHLSGVGFFVSHPENLILIRPDTETDIGDAIQWHFDFRTDAGNVWVRCGYNGTLTSVTRKIGDHSYCDVSKLKRDGTISVNCGHR